MKKPQRFARMAFLAAGLLAVGASPNAGPRSEDFVRLQIAAGEDLRNESFGARRIVRVGDTSFIGYSELVGNA